nr:hypothetical protein CFP56_25052 [Quercus suber]
MILRCHSLEIGVAIGYKENTTKNINVVNIPTLNRILQSEIFVHIDGQLHTAYMILGFTPISTRFQALKHVIQAHGSRLTRIDVAEEELIPFEEEEEAIFERPIVKNLERDFEVVDQLDLAGSSEVHLGIPLFAQVSIDQEATDILEGMMIKKNLVSLLSLLESKAEIATSKPSAPTKPLTLAPPLSTSN